MNAGNYASLEASRRLVEAGVVLETESVWSHICVYDAAVWILEENKHEANTDTPNTFSHHIPAPSMAEVWRELPDHKDLAATIKKDGDRTSAYYDCEDNTGLGYQSNTNPTDALIDLLIWVRKEASHD